MCTFLLQLRSYEPYTYSDTINTLGTELVRIFVFTVHFGVRRVMKAGRIEYATCKYLRKQPVYILCRISYLPLYPH